MECSRQTSEHKLWPVGEDVSHLVTGVGEHVGGVDGVGGVGVQAQGGGGGDEADGDQVALGTSSPAMFCGVRT